MSENQTYTLGQISALIGAELRGDSNCQVSAIASIGRAISGQLTFFIDSSKHLPALECTKASAVLLTDKFASKCPTNALIVPRPKLALAKVLDLIYPAQQPVAGVHPSSVIGAECKISVSAHIGPQVAIGDNVQVGDNSVICAGVYLGDGVKIGDNCKINANTSIYSGVRIGNNAVIHSGCVIGADGFGFDPQADGTWLKLSQLGSVVIGDDVEIGANTTIDRGALDDTVIGNGVKLDNLVMIAHNAQIGDNTVIAGTTVIAGSANIGRNCVIAGACAINGHIDLVDGVVVSGMGMVTKSLLKPGVYSSGTGILPRKDWQKSAIRFKQLDSIYQRLRLLEQEK